MQKIIQFSKKVFDLTKKYLDYALFEDFEILWYVYKFLL